MGPHVVTVQVHDVTIDDTCCEGVCLLPSNAVRVSCARIAVSGQSSLIALELYLCLNSALAISVIWLALDELFRRLSGPDGRGWKTG